MAKRVLLVGTLDTKGPEFRYLRDRLSDLGLDPIVADVGILRPPLHITPDISSSEVAESGGTTLQTLQQAGSRGKAVAGMRDAITGLVQSLYSQGKIDGIMSMGGAEGAVMGASAMMGLPVGFPKVLISPIASGMHYFDPLVGTSDMTIIHSVVDILGLNPIACTIFDNAAAAMKGMVEHGSRLDPTSRNKGYVAVTMLGNTTTAVMALKERLAEHGYEAVIFHSNGVGGAAMEELAAEGHFEGVIDYTTNEVTDPLTGGIHDAGPERLSRVGLAGIPQVVVPGCIDFSVFHTGAVPPALQGRPVYDHNPEYVLVRTSRDEMVQLGELFAERLSRASGPVQIVVPTLGLSIPSHPEGVFWNPESDAAFLQSLRESLHKRKSSIPIETASLHINDPACGELVADRFIELMQKSI